MCVVIMSGAIYCTSYDNKPVIPQNITEQLSSEQAVETITAYKSVTSEIDRVNSSNTIRNYSIIAAGIFVCAFIFLPEIIHGIVSLEKEAC